MADTPVPQWPLPGVDPQIPPSEIGLPNWRLLDDFGDRPIKWMADVVVNQELLAFSVVPGIAPGLFEVYAVERLRVKVGFFPTGEPGTGYLPTGEVEDALAGLIRRYGVDPYSLPFQALPVAAERGDPERQPTATADPHAEVAGGSGSEWVYVIEGGGLFKIGVARDVSRRLSGLQTGSPAPLRVVGTATGGYPREQELHRRFSAVRQHGEWFALRDLVEGAGGWEALIGSDFRPGPPLYAAGKQPQCRQPTLLDDGS